MKTCGQCIYWQKVKSLKDYGDCMVEVPPWVDDTQDDIIFRFSKMAETCPYFREEQEDV